MTTYAIPPKFIYDVLGAIGEISVDEAWAAICREWAKMKAREHSAAYIHQTVPLTDGDRVVDTTPSGNTQPLRDMVCQLRKQLHEAEQRVVTLEGLCLRHESGYRTLARQLEQKNATIELLHRQIDRHLPCPDHRDKVSGECPVCFGERTERARGVYLASRDGEATAQGAEDA